MDLIIRVEREKSNQFPSYGVPPTSTFFFSILFTLNSIVTRNTRTITVDLTSSIFNK